MKGNENMSVLISVFLFSISTYSSEKNWLNAPTELEPTLHFCFRNLFLLHVCRQRVTLSFMIYKLVNKENFIKKFFLTSKHLFTTRFLVVPSANTCKDNTLAIFGQSVCFSSYKLLTYCSCFLVVCWSEIC